MRWNPSGRSRNLEDQRGASSGGGGFGGFGGGGGGGGARLGIGGVIVLAVLSMVFGRDLVTEYAGGGAPSSAVSPSPGDPAAAVNDPGEESMVRFVSAVLDSSQVTWGRLIPQFPEAKLVLFRNAISSACGFAEAASGPFYCPGDQKVYLDLAFFDQLERQFAAPGDFARAYVIAHEVGHHVQNVTGTERKMRQAQEQNPGQAKALSVAMELQADCYAGVWGNSAAKAGYLEASDMDEGLAAASAVGDDRLQKMSTGRVNPESFTHGSSADRRAWFKRGFDSGDPNQCDTFSR